jgi:AcrR family transcriptional regulator
VSEVIEPQSRRDRPAKALLSRVVIIETALELVAELGLDAVTLRKVADRLDTGPASLYVYIENRDELLERMLDRALSEVPQVPVKHKRWRRRLVELFTETLGALDRYPGIAQAALGSPLSLPAATTIGDNALGLLREGGLDEQSAVWARDALVLFTVATAVQNASLQRPPLSHRARAVSPVAADSQPSADLADADTDDDGADGPDANEQFTFSLNAIIRGSRDSQPPL